MLTDEERMTDLNREQMIDLIERLQSLGKTHSDMTIGEEAAKEIIRLIHIIVQLMDMLEACDKGELTG